MSIDYGAVLCNSANDIDAQVKPVKRLGSPRYVQTSTTTTNKSLSMKRQHALRSRIEIEI